AGLGGGGGGGGEGGGAGRDRSPPPADLEPLRAAVTYVGGMTDRYAFDMAVDRLSWDPDRLPRGIDTSGR
ncbi:MAG: hypothetical protein M3R71_03115, partial [Actinomycetota bacterium]|nr:hypothetical protein [Actinomycetota bacterium]